MSSITPKALLDAVNASPKAVASHDKTAWLQLFDASFHLEDPVGSRPIHDTLRLEQFYQSFIAPNTIHFQPQCDYTGQDGPGRHSVWRDLALEIELASDVKVTVPMHLHYQLREQGSELRVCRLAAHWALWPMIKQLAPYGIKAVTTGWKLTLNIWRNLGWFGLSGFGLALLTPASAHEKLLEKVLGGQQAIALHNHNGQAIAHTELQDYRAIKIISAGRFITATLNNGEQQGLLVLARAYRLGEITSAQFFRNSDCASLETCA